ncbi:MAG: CheY-P-specific phosphatase CheC [Firmicutes bacterium]|nr:chemotaxis protein CheC [Bacillota bacterium]NLL87420.1 CheY-P-specific phosphatase CheC [Bacillota bacterium]
MEQKLDFLSELGNIGASYATTALSKMLNDARLRLTVPQSRILSFAEAASFIADPEEIVVCVYMRLMESFQADMALIFPIESALALAVYLTSEKTDQLTELGQSALLEVGNIVLSSYLTALSMLSGAKLNPTVPAIAVDMNGAIWESILADAGITDCVTVLDTHFFTDKMELSGHLFFMPDHDIYEIMSPKVSGLLLEENK